MKNNFFSIFFVLILTVCPCFAIDHIDHQSILIDIQKSVRCPICSGQSIYESDTDLAIEMKRQINDMYMSGKNKQDIFAYLRDYYGDDVLFEPPYNEQSYILWWAPVIFLLIFLCFAFIKSIYRRKLCS